MSRERPGPEARKDRCFRPFRARRSFFATRRFISVFQTRVNSSYGDSQSDIAATSSTNSTAQSSGGGGLLGGVGSTVGGVANTATFTVGGLANTAGSTIGSTTQTVGGTLRGVQVTQSSGISAQGGSTLSLAGGNLKLDKVTTFNLSVNQSSSVSTTKMDEPKR